MQTAPRDMWVTYSHLQGHGDRLQVWYNELLLRSTLQEVLAPHCGCTLTNNMLPISSLHTYTAVSVAFMTREDHLNLVTTVRRISQH